MRVAKFAGFIVFVVLLSIAVVYFSLRAQSGALRTPQAAYIVMLLMVFGVFTFIALHGSFWRLVGVQQRRPQFEYVTSQ